MLTVFLTSPTQAYLVHISQFNTKYLQTQYFHLNLCLTFGTSLQERRWKQQELEVKKKKNKPETYFSLSEQIKTQYFYLQWVVTDWFSCLYYHFLMTKRTTKETGIFT